jgi:hypothetical protein
VDFRWIRQEAEFLDHAIHSRDDLDTAGFDHRNGWFLDPRYGHEFTGPMMQHGWTCWMKSHYIPLGFGGYGYSIFRQS